MVFLLGLFDFFNSTELIFELQILHPLFHFLVFGLISHPPGASHRVFLQVLQVCFVFIIILGIV